METGKERWWKGRRGRKMDGEEEDRDERVSLIIYFLLLLFFRLELLKSCLSKTRSMSENLKY